ncbi:nitrate- and nitrite sensing domain-containing protein [Streptomyces sp. P38-E01]|uniref:histidine kinase n=1 Tax=Streptomyces tardus TaxID=2780544 RepID=A0A949JRY9_9ACTN|nr:nitrate- and nitrite sensing domain-containing protein [Streptomyces tardus]MBU7600151.1 nitrate- and nitrite sensing domain-containing protein [Streptomyces tardus]
MRFRGKTIRRKIVALLVVPLLALVSMWGMVTHQMVGDAKQILDVRETVDELSRPIEQTVRSVQFERRQALVYLADPRRSDALPRFKREQRASDQAAMDLRESARAVRGKLSSGSRERLDGVLANIDGLESLREKVERNTVSRPHASTGYDGVIEPSYELLSRIPALDHATLDKEARAIAGLMRGRELLAREDALMAASLAAGRMTQGEFQSFSDRVAERRITYRQSFEALPDSEAKRYGEYWQGPDGRTLTSFEDEALRAGPDEAVRVLNADRWDSATASALLDLEELDRAANDTYEDRVDPVAHWVFLRAAVAAFVGLLAVLATIVISFRVGRGLVRDLRALRKEAKEASAVRLPSVQRRLAAGEQIDVETEAPRLEYGDDEIGQVGHALNTLQRAAVEGAVRQADMRRGVSEVFVNLARRSQVLLHRQLTLLDTMERRTEDADELADLFRLDHLTTRMRRHAEGLVILSGAAPSRQWRKPVQLMDVVRAAVAEVEDYERIEVRRLERLAVDGPAVADLTHLVAELLENATVYSPPHTGVQVMGERVSNGFTLEIHDRGLGMTPDALLEANLRLAETPEFELSDTDRLGLFVVSRLAQRQGVRVSLQPSPYGGTTAVVLIPGAILNESTEAPAEPLEAGREDGRGASPALAQRLALGRRPGAGSVSSPPQLGASEPPAPRRTGRPVELDAALEELDEPEDSIGRLFRGGGEHERPHGDQQSGAEDTERDGGPRPAHHDGPLPLPRRRPGNHGGPVLVSDHGRTVGEHRPREEGADNDPAVPSPAAGPSGESAFAAGRSDADGSGRTAPDTVDGLPRRVRQASLAPQLKTPAEALKALRRGSEGRERSREGEAEAERDPDEIRSRMASLQRGWQRGRQHNDGSTPEGNGR